MVCVSKHAMKYYVMFSFGLILFWLLMQGFFLPPQEYGDWGIVVTRALLLSSFVLFIPFKRKLAYRCSSVTVAFIVAFYAEMYGFPLTLFLITVFLEHQMPSHVQGLIEVPILFYHFLLFYMPLFGLILVFLGWSEIYKSEGKLVTTGLYGLVRHPQYLGLLIATFGFLLAWPTILTLIMWPIMVVLYYRLAKEEEEEMGEKFGKEFMEYKKRVPMFLPFRLKPNRVRHLN